MPIYNYLDLSTAHLASEETRDALEDAAGREGISDGDALPRVISHAHGYWIHVPTEDWSLDQTRPFSWPDVHRIIAFAREHDCRWINIDQDADEEPELPTFEW